METDKLMQELEFKNQAVGYLENKTKDIVKQEKIIQHLM